ncbi:DUF2235 domain-containing protein [Stenotrophomonas sp. 278]|uniref:phospholipase effector Tle1 domain-containing protein n=1 Tax=Stenotrophomonas sp. 278 TaxID=2479851 RepID=UPI000F6591E6|nr:DUF2235 domain-containing protein [Stenotrophomonas sp. 278]RRU11961.1 DUF2235 domain-containing protein [Stenotrophomonas sp. 278]
MNNKDLSDVKPVDDDVAFYSASDAQLRTYQDASDSLARLKVPQLVDSTDPHARLYVAAFDGTGNDAAKDPLHATNVSRIDEQIKALSVSDSQVHVRYLEGPGTQRNPFNRVLDGALGYTYEERLERMYADLTEKANDWYRADPDTQIRVFSTGFSRGASQAAGFTNLLHERGIVDLDSRTIGADGQITYTRHIAPPGLTPQAVGLFDPVATGFPEKFDRRLAPSVVSGFQITAMDEVRAKFRNDQIIAPGLSEDGRFLNVQVAGAHADVGGGYIRDGLARRSCNLMVDYCNALRPGAPLTQKVNAPDDPRLDIVHRSEEHMLIYQMDRKVDRSTPGGVNTLLAPDHIVQADGLPHAVKPLGSAVAGLKPSDVVIAPPNLDVEQTAARLQFIEAAEKARAATIEQTSRVRVLGNTTAAVATTLEVADATRDYTQLRNESNLTAAQASITRTTTTAGMAWAGFQVGARVGGTLGPWGALGGGTLGAAIGGVAGDKIADEVERNRIYTHRGSDGNDWTADPKHPEKGWTLDLPPLPGVEPVKASPALADELNYKAVTKATELAMGAATPNNPLKLAARQDDPHSSYGGDWVRNAAGTGWQREVNTDKPGLGRTQHASPERAAELDAQSSAITADNAARSPAVLAANFKVLYEQNDWQRHSKSKLPEAVADALRHPERVVGSDGRRYARQDSGEWISESWLRNKHAKGDLRAELDLAFDAQRDHVQKVLDERWNPLREPTTLETVRVVPSPEQLAEQAATVKADGPVVEPQEAKQPERLSDTRHPGNAEFQRVLRQVHHAEAGQGIKSGPHSEKIAAALLAEGERQGVQISRVRIAEQGQIEGLSASNPYSEAAAVRVDSTAALKMTLEVHSREWADARSPHLAQSGPVVERTAEQQRGISALSIADQGMFARIRQDVPGHISDDQVMRALLDAKQARIADVARIDKVMMAGDRIFIAGTVPGFRSVTDVAQEAPPLQETVARVQESTQQREQQVALEQQQQQERGPRMG